MDWNELNDRVRDWSIEDEEMLINKLKDYCDNYKTYCESLDNELKAIEKHIDITHIDLLNRVNCLNKLSITKYAVFTIDNANEKTAQMNDDNNKTTTTTTTDEKLDESNRILSKEDKEKKLMQKYKAALDLSVSYLPINQSNTNEKMKQKKKLPFIIGTREFFNSESLGILNENENNKRDDIANLANDSHKNNVKVKEERIKLSDNKDNNKNNIQKDGIQFDSHNLKVKSFNMFDDRNISKDQEDFDDLLIQQYNTVQAKQSNSKQHISIDQFVKKGLLFDLDDEGDEFNHHNDLFGKAKLSEKKEDDDKVNEFKQKVPIKSNVVTNDTQLKTKGTTLESAKQKLLEMFEEDNDDNEENNTKTIVMNTDEMTQKLNQITRGNMEKSTQLLLKERASDQIVNKEDTKDKAKPNLLFFIEDEECKDDDKKQLQIKEKKEIKSQKNINSSEPKSSHSNNSRLDSIFNDDDDNIIITQPKLNSYNERTNPQQIPIEPLHKGEIIPLQQLKLSSFEKTKALLNSRLSSLPFSQTNNDSLSPPDNTTEIQPSNNINIQNNSSIIQKKKPHKPAFELKDSNHNLQKSNKPPPSFNPLLPTNEPKNQIDEKNKIVIHQKPLIKLNFSFDDDDED